MNRRDFIDFTLGAGVVLAGGRKPARAQTVPSGGSGRKLAVPTPEQTAWQDLEIGMFGLAQTFQVCEEKSAQDGGTTESSLLLV